MNEATKEKFKLGTYRLNGLTTTIRVVESNTDGVIGIIREGDVTYVFENEFESLYPECDYLGLNYKEEKKILCLKSFDPDEMQYMITEVPEKVIESFLPTDLEAFINVELELIYLTQHELDVLNMNGNMMWNGCSYAEAKAEAISDLHEELDALNIRIAKLNELKKPIEEVE
jgi:hypothetical protein